jgi:hypothetical protein
MTSYPRVALPAMLLALVMLCIGAAAPAAGSAVQPPAIAAGQTPYNIVLIGWDAAQREHVQQCLSRGELPNLAALGKTGALVDIDIAEKTDTKAGWSQILTGYSAAVTGVYSNSKYQPIPAGYSLFERAEKFFGPANVATLAVIGKSGHVDNNPPVRIELGPKGLLPAGGLGKLTKKAWRQLRASGKVEEEGGKKYLVVPGKPYYLTQNGMDMFQNGLHENAKVGARALEVLRENKDRRFVIFIHFAEVDANGHKFGENSKEYNDALIDCDAWLGKIEAELGKLGIDGKTAVYVTADHGFDEGAKQHKNAPYVFLATNDRAVTHKGTRADITPMILKRLGIELGKIDPPLTGKPLN